MIIIMKKRFLNDGNTRKYSTIDCAKQKRNQQGVKEEEVKPQINKKQNFRMINMDYAENIQLKSETIQKMKHGKCICL